VYALSRTKSTLDSLVEECPGIIPITADLQNWDETRSKLEKLETLDGLVNNAGSIDFFPALEWPKDQIDGVMSTILFGAINCIQVIARKMIDAKTPGTCTIVNIGGITGVAALPNFLGGAVAKAGQEMVAKQFALELGPYNIRVNSVAPTLVLTDTIRSRYEAGSLPLLEYFSERAPIGLPSVENVVQPVLYLLSECSSMVTGTTHVVDGGTMCNITTKQ